jgi:hypothetical protein
MRQRENYENLIKRKVFERLFGKVKVTRQGLPVSRKKMKGEEAEGKSGVPLN